MSPRWLIVAILGISFAEAQFAPPHEHDCGPLCDYVRKDDGYYTYEYLDHKTYCQNDVCTYMFNVTSQRWRPDDSWMNRPVWWHWLIIHIPDNLVFTEHALMWVGSGSNNDMNGPGPSSNHVRQTELWSQRSGMVTAVIRQIPNQPITFKNTVRERTEDSIIAYTWKTFINQPSDDKDPEVVLRMPMTKAVSKAMTTLQDVLDTDPKGTGHRHKGTKITGFMVAGESKRGWTTWMMPPVDSRVKVIAPVVLSCLNIQEVFPKYYMSLDGWPVAIGDYWLANIMSYMGDPKITELTDIVDPYSANYRQFLDLPKLMISGSKDEFFMMDDYDYFYDGLPGEKHMWLQENTGHDTNGGPITTDHWRMMETFFVAYLMNKRRPTFEYQRHVTVKGGSILMNTDENVSSVVGWAAVTPDMVVPRRDFRSIVLTPLPEDPLQVFVERNATSLGNGWYELYYDNPPEGHYLAFFMKITFPWKEEDREFIFSTKALYLPPGLPYQMCRGPGIQNNGCRGILK